MIKAIQRKILFYMMGLILSQYTSGLSAQQAINSLDELVSLFQDQVSFRAQEKVFIHTDKHIYLTGETLWFKAYCVDAARHKLTELSTIVYIELFDEEGGVVFQEKVQLVEGMGKGQFFLHANLESGAYLLRAYTKWMRNFDHAFFFEKTITLINPFHPIQLKSPSSKKTSQAVSARNDIFKLQASSDGKAYIFFAENLPGEKAYLLVHCRGIVQFAKMEFIQEGKTSFTVPLSELGTGINHITLFDGSFRPEFQRLVYKPPPLEDTILIRPSKAIYGNREEVKVDVKLPGHVVEHGPAHISVSVYKTFPDEANWKLDIANYLLVESDLKSSVHPKEILNKKDIREKREDLNQYLLDKKWARFEWQQLLAASPAIINKVPEIKMPIIQLKASPQMVGKVLVASVPGEAASIYTNRIDKQGNAFFEIPLQTTSNEIVFWSPDANIKDLSLDIQADFAHKPSKPIVFQQNLSESLLSTVKSFSLNSQIANAYLPYTHIRGIPTEPIAAKRPFYGKPDAVYVLENYTPLPTIDEVFVEIVRNVSRKNKKREVYVWDLYANEQSIENSIYFPKPGLVMVDGLPIKNVDKIWEMDASRISRIEIVNRKFYTAEQAFYGLINLISVQGDFGGLVVPETGISSDLKRVLQARSFYLPSYKDSASSRIPDYRTLLFWEPDLRLSDTKQIRFFSSDDTGTYRIEINGICADGTPITGSASFLIQAKSR